MTGCLATCCSDFSLNEPEATEHKDMLTLLRRDMRGTGYYLCNNWDPETTLCKIYASRPQMCRDYPEAWFQKNCSNPECTYQEKEPSVP